jgi:hypothetical protein
VGDALDLVRAASGIVRPQGERDDRHIVDALGLDQRFTDAELLRQPVAIRVDRVVEAHQRLGARHADLELRGHDRESRLRDREHVLEAVDLADYLLGRGRNQRLHVFRRGAGKRDQHVRHGDVDLRLLLARRHQNRESAQQQRDERDQRREPRLEEEAGDAPGDAHDVNQP